MSLLINFSFFMGNLILIFLSAYILLHSLEYIARFLKISEFLAGFLILGVGTSLPELFVGIQAALDGNSSLALGNVIGSNIIGLTLVIGLPILLARGIKLESKTLRRDTRSLFVLVSLPVILMFIGKTLSRIDGVILISAFLIFFWRLKKQEEAFTKLLENKTKPTTVALHFFILFIGIIVLFISSNYVIKYAGLIAIDLSLTPIFIGLFLIALGTSLPELIVGCQSALRGKKSMAVGNVVGTVVSNATLVLGIAAVINPIKANFVYFTTSAIFMILMSFLFVVFAMSGKEFDWREGLAMVLMYLFFLIIELNLRSVILIG